jgi:hypothetical protein
MHRLARLLRSDVGALVLYAATAALMVLAALAGWGWVLGLALVANYVADARLFLVGEEVVGWLNKRQLASAQRAFLRQASAVLGWALIARPEAWLALLVVGGVVLTHLTHAAYRVLSGRNQRQRRGRLGWLNLDVDGRTSGPRSCRPPSRTWPP